MLWPMQLLSYGIAFDQMVRRGDFEHGVQQLINIQKFWTEVFIDQTSKKLSLALHSYSQMAIRCRNPPISSESTCQANVDEHDFFRWGRLLQEGPRNEPG